MSRPESTERSSLWWCLTLASVLAVGADARLAAQGAQETDPPAAESDENLDPLAGIDQILAGEEEAFAGIVYSYDPGNRRDPFKSLAEAAQEKKGIKGALPEGIEGLLIDDVVLTGIFRTSQGFLAQVRASSRGKSYLIRAGDQLYDGDVLSVAAKEVVFKQIVNDPTVIKPFREVVKKLSP